ncbi:MOP flippase family protein [Rahnella victoriana]|uniref:MOP flippase family protein n=1 Tax=Rahnella victoriana TaxID=1510570 RepID=A0ABS0DKK9_9GAMM|nr:MOP flippase family protein [Rahnella victoriana]MBF7954437.1 MOP flippase family protein [Rahnella victoriana]TBX30580.1 MOP flippase family protein [Rahnella victoriana]
MGLLNNVKWVSLSQITKVGCQLLGMIVFSRFLSPGEIGLMSMALVVVNFTNILRDMGSSAAIIQREVVTEDLKKSVFTLNVVLGIVLFILVFFFSDYIAQFYDEPQLANILKIIAITFPINSATAIHLALLERESVFFKIAKVEVFSSLASLCIAVSLSIYGAGVYSLVVQTLVYSIFSAVGFSLCSSWRSSFLFSLKEIKSIFSFTTNLIAFNCINFASRNTDQIIIGKVFSSSVLGQYSLAYRLMLFPVQNITFVLTRSLYPLLSRLQNNKEEAFKVYLQSLRAISIITPPLMIGLAFISKDFVSLFFGSKWDLVSGILVWLAPVAIMQSMVSTTGSVFMSAGQTKILLLISIYNAILQVGAFTIGGFYSIEVLVKLYMVSNILMFIPNMYLAVKLLSGSFFIFLITLSKPVFCSLIMLGVLFFSSTYILQGVSASFLKIILEVIIGGLVYCFMIAVCERDFVIEKLSRFRRI